MPASIALHLVVDGADVTADERADLARQLREELVALDQVAVEPAGAGPLPRGAKAVEMIAFGALAATLAPEVVPYLVEVVASWLRRQPSDIAVEIDGQRLHGRLSRAQRDAIVAAYLDRVASKGAS